MRQKNQARAYLRGMKAAKVWKRMTTKLRYWDSKCMAKAQSLRLPAWAGHIPMAVLVVVMFSAIVFGGIVIASSAALIGAIALIAGWGFSSTGNVENDVNAKSCHTLEDDDYFMHCAKHGQFDGPYNSPSEKD